MEYIINILGLFGVATLICLAIFLNLTKKDK